MGEERYPSSYGQEYQNVEKAVGITVIPGILTKMKEPGLVDYTGFEPVEDTEGGDVEAFEFLVPARVLVE